MGYCVPRLVTNIVIASALRPDNEMNGRHTRYTPLVVVLRGLATVAWVRRRDRRKNFDLAYIGEQDVQLPPKAFDISLAAASTPSRF